MGGRRPPVARGARWGTGLLVRVFWGLAVGGLLAHAVMRTWEGPSAAVDEVTGGGGGQEAPHLYDFDDLARHGRRPRGPIWLPTETAEQVCRQSGGAGWTPSTRLPRDPVVPWWRWGSSRNGRNDQIIFITVLDWGFVSPSLDGSGEEKLVEKKNSSRKKTPGEKRRRNEKEEKRKKKKKKKGKGVEAFCGLVRDLGDALQVRLLPKWEGFGRKVMENISVLQEDVALKGKIVVLIDALDIFSVRFEPGAFRATFESFGSDVVLGGERGLRDLEFDASKKGFTASFKGRGKTTWPTQANAGFMVGRSEDLKQFLAALLDWGRPPNYLPFDPNHKRWDDQTALQLFLRAGAPGFRGSWAVDEKSLLVHTCAMDMKENFVLDNHEKVVWYRADSENDTSSQPPDRVIDPFFYHAPGGSMNRVCRNLSAAVQSWHGRNS